MKLTWHIKSTSENENHFNRCGRLQLSNQCLKQKQTAGALWCLCSRFIITSRVAMNQTDKSTSNWNWINAPTLFLLLFRGLLEFCWHNRKHLFLFIYLFTFYIIFLLTFQQIPLVPFNFFILIYIDLLFIYSFINILHDFSADPSAPSCSLVYFTQYSLQNIL